MSDSTVMTKCRVGRCVRERNGDDEYCVDCRHFINTVNPEGSMVTDSPLLRGFCATTGCSNRGYFNDDDAYCVTCSVAINHHARASSQRHELAMESQVGGDHYSKLAIQPIEYIYKNNIPFPEGSVIKYVTRWRDKGGIKDLQKAKHFIELLIELENANVGKAD